MEDISKFTKAALDTLSANEEKMKIAMFDIQKYFLGLLDNNNVIGSGRVKSSNSLREKILRKSYHVKYDSGSDLITSLDDIIGVRIICLLHNEEENTWKKISSNFKEIEVEEVKYYTNDDNTIFLEKIKLPVPQKNKHDIYKIHGYYLLSGERYNFELQIKSLVHMLWGEIEHLLFYKNYEYIIDNSFYSSVMDSMYRNLMNIDSQLNDITNQMRGKSDLVMFDELKRMLAKILYEKVNPAIELFLGCMIDLRECYDAVIEVVLHLSYYYKYQECLEHVQEVVTKINSIDIESLKTDIPYYEYSDRISSRDERIKSLSKIISKRSKDNVYYRLFVSLVGEMRDKRGAKDIIETLTEYYLKILSYEDDLEDDEIGTIREKLICSVADNFIIEIVTNYDFYWIINNSSYLMKMIRSIMSIVRGIDLDEGDDIDKVSVLMKDILILNILIDKNQKIREQLLQEIYDMSENDVWNKEELRNEEFLELIKNKLDEGELRKKLKDILSDKEVDLCIQVI